MKKIFAESGVLAKAHPDYEYRAGQHEMAEAVMNAIAAERHLLIEAGTGIGKTMAYLIPALESKKKFIISTGTKNLQEQIFFKDIPFIRKRFSYSFKACCMKGRENYLCLKRFRDFERQPLFRELEEATFFDTLKGWAMKTKTGDRGELKGVPEDISIWSDINAKSDTCMGKKCPYFKPCFLTLLKNKALGADIVIVNHHLFFADLSIRSDFGAVIPPYEHLIFDEAHMMEEVATNYFGISVSRRKFDELLRDAEKLFPERTKINEKKKIFAGAKESVDDFFSHFEGDEGKLQFPEAKRGLLSSRVSVLSNSFDLLSTAMTERVGEGEELENILNRKERLLQALQFLVKQEDRKYVYWYEIRKKNVILQASPIDVSEILRVNLFERVKCAIMTSATLSIAGDFSFYRERLGVVNHQELAVESPYDFEKQAIMYLPGSMPEPHEESFLERMKEDLLKLLEISEGRAFVLFTSIANMKKLHRMMASKIRYPLLLQGEMPKTELLEEFRSGRGAVLFATSSFWHGVDVQGESLSLVAIDKIPFDVPSDPLIATRIKYLKEEGRNAFYEYQLPMAVIELKQGLGRLIRSRKDKGILALFDPRVLTRKYGRVFLESLPPFKVTDRLDDVESFFKPHLD
ncbi:MAG: ATP-dependent DNA helicase [Acidobacteriota bacterium]